MHKKIKTSFCIGLVTASFFFTSAFGLAATNKAGTDALSLQIKAEFKKSPTNAQNLEKLLQKFVIQAKPTGYQTVQTSMFGDINKDKIPEVAAVYKMSDKTKKANKITFCIFKWDGKTSKYITSYQKTIPNVDANLISIENFMGLKYNQFLLMYSYYPNGKGIIILNYDNNKFKQVYSKQTNIFGFADTDKDRKMEFSEIAIDKKDKTKAIRTWKKWDGKSFKTTKIENTTLAKIEKEINAANKEILEKIYSENQKQIVQALKPSDFKTVEGYLFSDVEGDKTNELLVTFKKDGSSANSSVTRIALYKYDSKASKMVEVYKKDIDNAKINVVLTEDFAYGGNKEFVIVYTQTKQNMLVLSYNAGVVKEEFNKQADGFNAFDTDNDKKLEIAEINPDATDSTKQMITWLKWNGTEFAILKQEALVKKN